MTNRAAASITMYGVWLSVYSRPHQFVARLRQCGYRTKVMSPLPLPPPMDLLIPRRLRRRLSSLPRLDAFHLYPNLRSRGKEPLFSIGSWMRGLWERHVLSRKVSPSDILWAQDIPRSPDFVSRFSFAICDVVDDQGAMWGEHGHAKLSAMEEAFAARADLVLAVSRKLFERFKAVNPNTLLVPNGADVEHFAVAIERERSGEDELWDYRDRPVAGYVGNIYEWFSVEFLLAAAERLPEVTFILVGPYDRARYRRIVGAGLPNIRLLGPQPYQALPALLSYFDVGLIPFKINRLNQSTNPIKMYEYLAAGLPVVGTAMPEVKAFEEKGVVATAEDPKGFAACIREAIRTKEDGASRARRLEIGKANSWGVRLNAVLERLQEERVLCES